MMKRKLLLALFVFFCFSFPSFAQMYNTSSCPYGIWTGGNITPKTKEYVRGRFIWLKWRDLEAQKGIWTWGVLEERIKQAVKAGKYVGLVVYAGPDSPDWIYDNGVPKVTAPDKVNVRGGSHKSRFPYFPYYLDDDYREYWFNEIRTVAEWVESLPEDMRKRLLFVQTAEGTTDDEGPYKGIPYDEKYRFCDEHGNGDSWVNLKKEAWQIYNEKYSKMNPPVALMVNPGNMLQYEALLDTVVPYAWKKSGNPGHIYQFNGEKSYIESRKNSIWNRCANGKFRRFRSEFDEVENGWFKENSVQNMYWLCIYDLFYGMDILFIVGDAVSDPKFRECYDFFNKYAGQKDPSEAVGAFCAMKDVLDAADTERFPECKYGKATDVNKERFEAIAKEYEKFGAHNGDIDHAVGGPMNNRRAKSRNDVGFDLVPGNYELFLNQIDANATSIGWWNVGPKDQPYGRFARSFDIKNGKNEMYFVLNKGFFSKNKNKEVEVRVVYLDEGKGKWSLMYVDNNGMIKNAVTIKKQNTGRWKEINISIQDACFAAKGPKGSDLMLRNESCEDTKFHMIELTRKN